MSWEQVAVHSSSNSNQFWPLTTTNFDPFHELIWAGNEEGRIVSYMNRSLNRYTIFKAHDTEVRQMVFEEEGILSISFDSISFTSRTGVPIVRLRSLEGNLQSIVHSGNGSKYIVGGQENTCLIYDAQRGAIVKEMQVDQPIIIMKKARYICCGSEIGEIQLRDPRTLNIQHTLSTNLSGLYDLDVFGNLLVTCGYFERMGRFTIDPFLKVYDLRTLRQLPQIPFTPGPCLLKFHPLFSSMILAVSQSGCFQFVDVNQPSFYQNFHQLDITHQFCQSVDISTTGETLAFGDSEGFVHQWADRNDFHVNNFLKELEFPDTPKILGNEMTDDSPLSSIGMPYSEDLLLSNWPQNQTFIIGQPPVEIESDIIQNIKQIDFVGYAPNPGTHLRNQVRKKKKGADRPMFLSEQEKRNDNHQRSQVKLSTKLSLPKLYYRVEIQYSKLGVEDFDFGYFNKTKFGGLETQIPNSYCNSILQVLYFLPPLRHIMIFFMANIKSKDTSLATELGFLFRMLDDARGVNCHAGNFLKVFCMLPEASALGLMEPEKPTAETSYVLLIQNFNRFIVEHLQNEFSKWVSPSPQILQPLPPFPNPKILHHFDELSKQPETFEPSNTQPLQREPIYRACTVPLIQQIFGMNFHTIEKCSTCKNDILRESSSLIIDLLSPKKVKETNHHNSGVSFSQVLSASINKEIQTKAWCAVCNKYKLTFQHKIAQSLPNVLTLNCGTMTEEDMNSWKMENHFEPNQVFENDSQNPFLDEPKVKVRSWIPPWIDLQVNNSISVSEIHDAKTAKSTYQQMIEEEKAQRGKNYHNFNSFQANDPPEGLTNKRIIYELVAVIAQIHNGKDPPNLVAHIKVPQSYQEKKTSHKSDQHTWYLFNDFFVTPIAESKALYFNHSCKIPVILYFSSIEIDERIDVSFLSTKIPPQILFDHNSRTRGSTKHPLQFNEIPKKGFLCALDAEFVATKEEETDVRSDGSRQILTPAHYTLARVSVVRGFGHKEGVPFIDDYIAVTEPIVDYLTKFSGINPGDLDPITSPYPLISRRTVYTKLRLLIDLGCIFIGHGLKKDFRIINILVPPGQVIDTVEIFRLKGQRNISLRFLSWYLLNKDIQKQTHCSIEDAVTALEIYKKYLELKNSGTFERVLEEIYDYGRKINWEIVN